MSSPQPRRLPPGFFRPIDAAPAQPLPELCRPVPTVAVLLDCVPRSASSVGSLSTPPQPPPDRRRGAVPPCKTPPRRPVTAFATATTTTTPAPTPPKPGRASAARRFLSFDAVRYGGGGGGGGGTITPTNGKTRKPPKKRGAPQQLDASAERSSASAFRRFHTSRPACGSPIVNLDAADAANATPTRRVSSFKFALRIAGGTRASKADVRATLTPAPTPRHARAAEKFRGMFRREARASRRPASADPPMMHPGAQRFSLDQSVSAGYAGMAPDRRCLQARRGSVDLSARQDGRSFDSESVISDVSWESGAGAEGGGLGEGERGRANMNERDMPAYVTSWVVSDEASSSRGVGRQRVQQLSSNLGSGFYPR